MRKKLFVITALLLGIGGGMYVRSKLEKEDAFPSLLPRSTDVTASSDFLNAQKAIEYYRDAIRKNPDVPQYYVELAHIYLQEARFTALHHEYLPKAERLLTIALEKDPDDAGALVTRASMLATLHHFEEAQSLVTRALAANPFNAFALSVLLDTQVELGHYDEAVRTSERLLALRPDLRAYARAAYLRELHGDLPGAITAMRMACDAGVAGQENRAWVLYNLGRLYLQTGKPDTTAYIFNGILQERPGYAYALAGLADVHSSRRQYDEAETLLKKAYAIIPDHTFLEQLAGVYRAAGKKAEAEKTIRRVLSEFDDHHHEGWNVDHEFAMFCANHDIELEEAVERAKRDYDRRPMNIDAIDAYAWALYKSGKSAEAAALIGKALRLGTNRAEMQFRASLISEAAGNRQRAVELLRRATTHTSFIKAGYENALNDLRQRLDQLAVK